MSLSSEKEIVQLEKYLKKQGREELIEELRKSNNDELRDRLTQHAEQEQAIIDTKNKDKELEQARQRLSSLSSIYSEQLRVNKKITRFIHLLINE